MSFTSVRSVVCHDSRRLSRRGLPNEATVDPSSAGSRTDQDGVHGLHVSPVGLQTSPFHVSPTDSTCHQTDSTRHQRTNLSLWFFAARPRNTQQITRHQLNVLLNNSAGLRRRHVADSTLSVGLVVPDIFAAGFNDQTVKRNIYF